MTLTPCPSIEGELILEQPNHRAAGLARALGARKLRRLGKVRYFLGPRQAEQFTALYGAGFWFVRRSFRRDPRGLGLYAALAVARNIPLDGKGSLTAKPLAGSLAAKEPKHTD